MKQRCIPILMAVVMLIGMIFEPLCVYAEEAGESPDPDEVFDGGSLVARKAGYDFYNDPEDMCFYARNSATDETVKLTDFPAANINVYNGTLIFTDMTGTVSTAVHSSYINTKTQYRYGGRLYRITDISGLQNGVAISRIGEEGKDYYNIRYDEKGFYALTEAQDGITRYEKLDENGAVIATLSPGDGETIIDAIEISGYLYLEMMRPDGISYILCIDRDNGSGSRTVFEGMQMHLMTGRIIFWNTEDLYIYAVEPGDTEAYVISYLPASSIYTLHDYIFCEDGFGHYNPVNFCISLTSAVSPYENTFYVPVNGWLNMCEVFEFAPGIRPPGPTPIKKKEDTGKSTSSSAGEGTTQKERQTPPDDGRPDPEDAVREVEDFCDYLKYWDLNRLKYNDTQALRDKFIELYWDGETKSLREELMSICYECVDDLDRRIGKRMSSGQKDETAEKVYQILAAYLDSLNLDCWLKREVREGLAVVTVHSDHYLKVADIYSDITRIDQIYSLGTHQVDYVYGDFQIDVKVSYKAKEDHWRIDKKDLDKFISLIFVINEPPPTGTGDGNTTKNGGAGSRTVSSTDRGQTGEGTEGGDQTGNGQNGTGQSGTGQTGESQTGSGPDNTGNDSSCIPVREIPDLVFIREKNKVDINEGFIGNEDTESAIRAYKELLEGYSYSQIADAFRTGPDSVNLWFLGDDTRKELGEQVKTIKDHLLDDYYKQLKNDPSSKYSDKELEEEKKKDEAAFTYLNKMIRDYNPQTFSEKAVALYDGIADRIGSGLRNLKGVFTGKDHSREYEKEQLEARNRAYGWMMNNIYSEMYDRAKSRIDQDKYKNAKNAKNISYCLK